MSGKYGDPVSTNFQGKQGKAAIASKGITGGLGSALSTIALLTIQKYFPDLEGAQAAAYASLLVNIGIQTYGRWVAKQPITSWF